MKPRSQDVLVILFIHGQVIQKFREYISLDLPFAFISIFPVRAISLLPMSVCPTTTTLHPNNSKVQAPQHYPNNGS